MNPDATMNEMCGKYAGMDRFACRKALVADFEAAGVVDHIEKHMHQVGHSERTGVIVEPYLSKQWFVKMKPLADAVLENQQIEEEKIHFYPKRFEKTFQQWLENIEDWCISRIDIRIHRIPAWYHKESGEVYVGEEAPKDIENWEQDEDVLDTWFSSALWPFSTLGWPQDTPDLERYFPNDVLVTGYDIIFFWVARMAFQSRYCMKSRPFKDVLIHGLVRDEQGRKMSKSLGNGIDPMDVIDTYGVDALRFFLTTNSTPGQDLRFSAKKIEASWNFINKIWNATRFVQLQLEDFDQTVDLAHASTIDKWILKRFDEVLASVTENMEKYEFALVGNELYSFIWDDFCSWYIELSKAGLQSEDATVKHAVQSTLFVVLQGIVKMLHPFMPFVTEEIYLSLPHEKESINLESWPKPAAAAMSEEEMFAVRQLLSMISAVREIKTDYQLKPSTPLEIAIKDEHGAWKQIDENMAAILQKMCHASCTSFAEDVEVVARPIYGGTLSTPLAAMVDLEEEIAKLEKELDRLSKEVKRSEGMLRNENFVKKAPAAKVEEEREKLERYQKQYAIVQEELAEMKKKKA